MRKTLLILTGLALLSIDCTADSRFECPQHINVSNTVSSPVEGWSTMNNGQSSPGQHPLIYATFSDGNPAEEAFLKPVMGDNSDAAEDSAVELYEFSAVSPEGIYLVCGYSETTEILFKPVGIKLRQCKVTTPSNSSELTIQCN